MERLADISHQYVWRSTALTPIPILDDSTILYRQHTSNTLGAEQARKGFFARAIARAGQKQFFQVAKLLHKDFGLSYLKFLMYKILYSWF